MCTVLQLRTSSEKKTNFVRNKTAIYGRNRSSLCLIFVKLARLCAFSSSIRPITYERASREHAFDASSNSKPEPQQRRQWEGAKVWQKNSSPQTLRSPKIRERLMVKPRSTADLVEVWALTGKCSQPVRECSPPDQNRSNFSFKLFRVRSEFAWALPWWFFSQKRQVRTRNEN